MKKPVLALALTLAAGPISADGLAFEPVAPTGISADRAANVAAFQQAFGAAPLAAMEAEGYRAYGAMAIPVAQAGEPVTVANLPTRQEAAAAALTACKEQSGTDCTVIGLLVPGS